MGKSIRANSKINELKAASIIAKIQRWQDGEFGKKLTWERIEAFSGFTRQALSRHRAIANAYQSAKRALATRRPSSGSRSTYGELHQLDQTIQSLRERLSQFEVLEQVWLERWQRIAYHCSRRGLSIEEFDKPIDGQERR
ncbi:hypothetical protein [Caballeronia sp. Lep1P3]|uniref:hypothetical protein n=1 Tax=Caballeronia sp. Lep1P3 TaxID=2878150 RepID=UPI001FD1A49E|nr:hypothetical protein [Caballeronia sp. Lep1P3]